MTFQETLNEIQKIIERSPYSKEEILSFLNVEKELEPDELFAYGIALEFLREKKGDYKKLERVFLKKRDEALKRYL